MTFMKYAVLGFFMVTTPLMITACDNNNSVEEAAEEVSDEIDDATTN